MRVQMLLGVASSANMSVYAQNNTTWPYQTYKSLPGFEPPQLEISTVEGSRAPGLIFFPISGSGAHNYSLNIYRQDGELVWQSGYGDYAAFKPTTLFGGLFLALWSSISFPEPWGFGYGIVKILNPNYENIYNPLYDPTQYETFSWIDMHENNITPRGTIHVGAMNVKAWDLTSVGGSENGWIVDSIILELNVTNSEIPLTDAAPTYPLRGLGQNQSYPWGPSHINSIDEFEDGSLLVSSRHYCSIFEIGRDGEHDARIHAEYGSTTLISIFNNDNSAVVSYVNQTTGIFPSADTDTKEATLLLSNGHSVMGYGSVPFPKEFDREGNIVQTVKWGQAQAVQSYRGYKSEWVGTPSSRPDAFACMDSNATINVYMSWNGATEHQSWHVLAGPSKGNPEMQMAINKTGFETFATFSSSARLVQVEAHGAGIETGISDVVAVEEAC
ncbi:hypothetical protein P171DRAFT_452544 [Karstenula rhodostoma CBS 690.94]|uniref:Uncharacterized protein n=1 Tax=Karstenula rhodostoma CBS 690.94 TaxID=1392251 RepID=A0A9P4PPE1_9PLEO|nr:hypothetical protein P171DRAFT_452544 [Karstenula rhodostoma CBS 690.94]